MAKEIKKVNFRLDRGIMINGKAIYPAKAKQKPVVLSLPELFAKELQAASKGEIVSDAANTEAPEKPDDDGLDAVFGKESDQDDK